MSSVIFQRIKTILKTKGISYAELAKRMALSEITIKRLFAENDCKLSRLHQLCDAIGIDLLDLIEAEGKNIPLPRRLEPEQSRALAKDPQLLVIFLLIRSRYTGEQITAALKLDKPKLYRALRCLEKLALVTLKSDTEAVLICHHPVDFLNDPQLSDLVCEINQRFVAFAFEEKASPDYRFDTVSRQLSAESATIINEQLRQTVEKIKQLAQRDAMLVEEPNLMPYKFTSVFGPAAFDRLLKPIGETKAHDSEKKQFDP